MGIDFGDEKSNYYDFSHCINIPHKRGAIKIFGMSGSSETIYRGKQDTARVEIQKELQNIDYNSITSINGISNVARITGGMFLKTVVAYSTKDVKRTAVPSSDFVLSRPDEKDGFTQQKISTLNYVSGRLSHAFRGKAGTYVNYFISHLQSGTGNQNVTGSLMEPVLEPFVSVEGNVRKWLEITAGLHSMYLPRINFVNLQPRCLLKFILGDANSISLGYGMSSQLQPYFLYLANSANANLKPGSNHAFSLLHVARFNSSAIKTELYYQQYFDIPVNAAAGFSAFNYFNELTFLPLTQNGTARVYGMDLRVEKNYMGFYAIASAGLYNSTYNLPGRTDIPSRFNTGYNTFVTMGKEFQLTNKNRFFSTDVRAMLRNGFREAGLFSPLPYYYDQQLPEYWRIDLRLSYKKNKANSAVIWAIDIQNVTNRRNVGYHYYDVVTRDRETKYQLGLIPVLSYKVMF
jgi:hypothetical protein